MYFGVSKNQRPLFRPQKGGLVSQGHLQKGSQFIETAIWIPPPKQPLIRPPYGPISSQRSLQRDFGPPTYRNSHVCTPMLTSGAAARSRRRIGPTRRPAPDWAQLWEQTRLSSGVGQVYIPFSLYLSLFSFSLSIYIYIDRHDTYVYIYTYVYTCI